MFFLAENELQIINSKMVERFCKCEKNDCVLIIASYGSDKPPVTIGRYADDKEATEALIDLQKAIAEDYGYYKMIPSRRFNEEREKKDARVKRRGGS